MTPFGDRPAFILSVRYAMTLFASMSESGGLILIGALFIVSAICLRGLLSAFRSRPDKTLTSSQIK
jgi:hypothetical protein